MTFSSSPVFYPPSSSPPVLIKSKKRKLFQSLPPTLVSAKKTKLVGAIAAEAEEDNHEDEADSPIPDNVVNLPSTPPSMSDELLNPADTSTRNLPASEFASTLLLKRLTPKTLDLHTSSGTRHRIPVRQRDAALSYEQTIAQRSTTAAGRAKKAYYGIDIHILIGEAKVQAELSAAQAEARRHKEATPEERPLSRASESGWKSQDHQLWTEKYRAKRFTELVGDERTHRTVLKWIKTWDAVVFPGTTKTKPQRMFETKDGEHERQHRKLLLLTGPPGLGKTTLAHVCARQAGYEVLEINASDDRSKDVVKGRIKDALGTETVRGIREQGQARRAGRPVCVVVDEVDGVTAGSSGAGGEGGFIKALIDLVQLDERNAAQGSDSNNFSKGRSKKGDKFRLLRPVILICNDVYAPSLRPLRNSSFAEVIHVRRPAIETVIKRMKTVFENERIHCDNDAVRHLCERSWGLGSRKQKTFGSRGAGEGDIRGVLVQAEWISHKLRAEESGTSPTKLTKKWLSAQLDSIKSGTGQKGLGRGGLREVVDRIFIEGAGLPNTLTTLSADETRLVKEAGSDGLGVADLRKRTAVHALREMIDASGEHDRLISDCFAIWPTRTFQDDVSLSKPNACYEWLHFHDSLSSRIFSGQEWELNPYLSTGACGFHNLFAAVDRSNVAWNEEQKEEDKNAHPFSGPRADAAAYEAERENKSVLTELQSSFSAPLLRMFSSVDSIATELIPNIGKMLTPEVKPVVVGGNGGSASVASVRKESERKCVSNAVRVMEALNVSFEKVRVELETHAGGAHQSGGFAYRMEPPLDTLSAFTLDKSTSSIPVRFAVRQVLDQELRKAKLLSSSLASQARSTPNAYLSTQRPESNDDDDDKENHTAQSKVDQNLTKPALGTKRDFFGRIINEARPSSAGNEKGGSGKQKEVDGGKIWVSFHEGYSNAVRKPISLREFLDSF